MYRWMRNPFQGILFHARRTLLIGSLAALALPAAAFAQDPNPMPMVPKSDPAMLAAFAHAAASLDGFLAVYRNPPPGAQRFAVKIGLIDTTKSPGYALVRPGASPPGQVEWFWTYGLTIEKDGFAAPLGNDPDELRNVKRGQVIRFAREHIGDWMYFQDGKIVGNATACP